MLSVGMHSHWNVCCDCPVLMFLSHIGAHFPQSKFVHARISWLQKVVATRHLLHSVLFSPPSLSLSSSKLEIELWNAGKDEFSFTKIMCECRQESELVNGEYMSVEFRARIFPFAAKVCLCGLCRRMLWANNERKSCVNGKRHYSSCVWWNVAGENNEIVVCAINPRY